MSAELEAAELLERSAEVLETDGWCKGRFLDFTGAHCAVGAMMEADGNKQRPYQVWARQSKAITALAQLVNRIGIIGPVAPGVLLSTVTLWNDRQDDREKVIDTMKLAAKDLRNRAEPE